MGFFLKTREKKLVGFFSGKNGDRLRWDFWEFFLHLVLFEEPGRKIGVIFLKKL